MGLRLFCPDEGAPIPRPVTMELRCDGSHMAGAPFQRFDADGFIAQYAAAMCSGWKETEEKVFLCPSCSGKVSAQGELF